jgi:hypothetical protein
MRIGCQTAELPVSPKTGFGEIDPLSGAEYLSNQQRIAELVSQCRRDAEVHEAFGRAKKLNCSTRVRLCAMHNQRAECANCKTEPCGRKARAQDEMAPPACVIIYTRQIPFGAGAL